MEVKKVKIGSVKTADFNPPDRSEEEKILGLKGSIEEIGLLYPVLVNPKMELVDGHRRLAACKLLGWTEIPVLVCHGEASRERMYADVNATTRHLLGSQVLYVFLHNRDAMTSAQRVRAEEAEEVLGKKLLKEMLHNGLSLQVYTHAKGTAVYCDRSGDTEFIRECVKWILIHGSMPLRLAKRSQVPAMTIRKAIQSKGPLVNIWSTHAE